MNIIKKIFINKYKEKLFATRMELCKFMIDFNEQLITKEPRKRIEWIVKMTGFSEKEIKKRLNFNTKPKKMSKEIHLKLGASLFIRNGIKYDYCFIEAIESVLPICDEVVVLECSSDDDTAKILKDKYSNNPKIKLILGQTWEVEENYLRLSKLANIAREALTTDWHFMIQADEVLHENSYNNILKAIYSEKSDRYYIRRYNLWGNHDAYIKFDSSSKPCSDICCRLAKVHVPACGDAESLRNAGACPDYIDEINLIHYGFVRYGYIFSDKIIDMQKWFWSKDGQEGNVDQRAVDMKKLGYWDASIFPESNNLLKLPFEHPSVMKEWVERHKQDKTYKVVEI